MPTVVSVITEHDTRVTFVDILALSKDWHVFTTIGGRSLLRMLDSVTPDLALIEVFSFDEEGLANYRLLRSHTAGATVPVTFVTYSEMVLPAEFRDERHSMIRWPNKIDGVLPEVNSILHLR